MTHVLFAGIATLLMLAGLALLFIPAFPAIFLMLLVAVGFGFVDGFTHLTTGNVGVLAGIFVLSVIIDQLAGVLGAKYGGASRKAILYGFLGLVIGTLLLPPLGGLIGLFLGVGVTEFYAHKNHERALKAAGGSVLGAVAGMFVNIVLGVIFIALFIAFAFW